MSGLFGLNKSEFFKYSEDLTKNQFYIGILILVPTGLVFNSLQVFVFTKSKHFNKSSTGFLFSILALLDSISLVWCIITYKYLPLVGFNLGLMSDFSCFTFQWFSRVVQQIPLYFQVFITIYNYIKVKYPLNNKLDKKPTILLILAVISISVCILNITNMFRYIKVKETIINSTNLTEIVKSCSSSNTMATVANFVTSLFRSYIPAIAMFILDILIIKILVSSKRNIRNNNLNKERNFAFVLLILDCVFFLFNVPISCTEQLVAVYENIYKLPSSDPTMAFIRMLHGFAATIAYVFYVLPFFINFIFNQFFRIELFRLIGLYVDGKVDLKKPKLNTTINTINTSSSQGAF